MWKSQISEWLDDLQLPPSREAEIIEELSQHLQDRYEELLATGLSETEASRTALTELNENDQLRRELRQVERPVCSDPINVQTGGGKLMFANLRQDVKYGIRVLLKRPSLTLVATLTLAIGIGANTAIFTVLNAVLLRPLPYPASERLMEIGRVFPGSSEVSSLSEAKFLFLRDTLRSFDSITATQGLGANNYLSDANSNEYITGLIVSSDFFRVIGVSPAAGRAFTAAEDSPSGERVVILGDGLWRRRFGSDPAIIGKTINLTGNTFTVIGIMPSGFEYFGTNDVLMPMRANPGHPNEGHNWTVIGRLRPEETLSRANAELPSAFEKFRDTYPKQVFKDESFGAQSWRLNMTSSVRQLLWILFGAVAFVLLIACANVANLQLTRAVARQKEMAIRIAIGGNSFRLIRQLATEGIVLALPGGLAGLALAIWGLSTLKRLLPEGMIPRANEISLDWRVLGLCFLATAVSGIFFGLAPALQVLRVDVNTALKATPSKLTGGRTALWLGKALVASEIALALALAVGAGLLLRTFANLRGVEQGFDSRNLLTFEVAQPGGKAVGGTLNDFHTVVLERLKHLPGVEGAAITNKLPLDRWFNLPYRLASHSDFTGSVEVRSISADYFQVMKMNLRKGRSFNDGDIAQAEPVIILNEAFVRRNYQSNEALDQLLCVACEKYGDPAQRRVVGVVNDTKQRSLHETAPPIVFIPYSQTPDASKNTRRAFSVVLRTSGNPLTLSNTIRAELSQIDPNVLVRNVRSMDQLVDRSVAPNFFELSLLALFAAIGLLLSAVGIYGVMTYMVSKRTQEIGVRMALGAQVRDVRMLVLKQCLVLALFGVIIGVVSSLALTRLMKSLLFGVSPTDPLTMVAVAFLIVLVALLASYLPVRRATKIDPLIALRFE